MNSASGVILYPVKTSDFLFSGSIEEDQQNKRVKDCMTVTKSFLPVTFLRKNSARAIKFLKITQRSMK